MLINTKSENASEMTSKKSKQHNVFEAEEQIWWTELVKFICPTTREWETTYTSTSLEKRCYASINDCKGKRAIMEVCSL